jgi:hypothetical protein
MDKIINWYNQYYSEITWFIIGWLSLAAVHDFGRGDWLGLLLDVTLVYFNYHLYKRH